MGVLLNSVVW